MAAPAGTNRRAAARESGPRVRPIIAKGDTDGRKACPKRRMRRAGGRRAGTAAATGNPGGPPYSMPTTVARSGTVTRARAVVMNVPWAIVFASPWYW